jgi:SAM-dependent methyltransferase
MTAIARWRAQLESWAIPPAILAAAPESPYGFPAELFRTRGSDAGGTAQTPTTQRALERLPEGGRVLDVGCGGGATSLPLAGRAGVLIGVDAQEDMLEGFLANARAAGATAEAVHGGWLEVAGTISPVDVAVAGHVLYNVAELEPFVRAIAGAARRRVVFELTERHPLSWMNDLWREFHRLDRPERPTGDGAAEAIREIGFDPAIERWVAPPRGGGFTRRADALALVRRRLCLPASEDEALADALGPRLAEREGLWSVGRSEEKLATIWFDP